ncbi:hypothetical protein SZN_21041 [Streptomyces zinciresistens K42]|uniref:Uncharacterized protein n=1 Tax=Streptomyces zinciresistens K42 TaxID=700597 RepID=G2GFC4_9ACTN|nr:hypothetical protein SZN_21041 [Streptomyces zinciresistens K42]
MGVLGGALLTGCSDGGSPGGGASRSPSVTAAEQSAPSPTATGSASEPTRSAVAETGGPPSSAAEDDTAPGGPDGASALWGKQYSGTAKVTVDVYDYCSADGSRQFAGTRTYSMDATLDLGSPRTGGGATESNPFSLLLAVGQPSQTGAVSFQSSAVAVTSGQDLAGNPRDPNLLLTYWQLEWNEGNLSGRLSDPNSQQAVTLNLLNWPRLVVACRSDLGELPGGFPRAVAEGTTLDGDLDGSSASLTARGSTGDGQVEFRFEFTGS